MIPILTTFHYAHPLGARGPYFDGLRQGRAMASRCAECGRGSFPPRHCCGRELRWEELPGSGTVVAATDGFALIAMDGADNLALGVLREPAMPGWRVRMAQTPETVVHPAQATYFQVVTDNAMRSE